MYKRLFKGDACTLNYIYKSHPPPPPPTLLYISINCVPYRLHKNVEQRSSMCPGPCSQLNSITRSTINGFLPIWLFIRPTSLYLLDCFRGVHFIFSLSVPFLLTHEPLGPAYSEGVWSTMFDYLSQCCLPLPPPSLKPVYMFMFSYSMCVFSSF